MKEVTRKMIQDYRLKELGYDFMGFEFDNQNQLSFHHLIVPHRDCKKEHIPSEGYVDWNGAILTQSKGHSNSHDYLHLIEKLSFDRFSAITSELIDINVQKVIYRKNLEYILDVLKSFEREYSGKRDKYNQPIIKPEYTRKRVLEHKPYYIIGSEEKEIIKRSR